VGLEGLGDGLRGGLVGVREVMGVGGGVGGEVGEEGLLELLRERGSDASVGGERGKGNDAGRRKGGRMR